MNSSSLNKISNTLNHLFSGVSLSEIDESKLMDRVDEKYIFHLSQLDELLMKCSDNYYCLEVCNKRMSLYKTLYFDTPNFDIYLQHHNGKLNRNKIRYRNYVDSNVSFIEVKSKLNKGRTVKSRVETEEWNHLFKSDEKQFVENNSTFFSDNLTESIWVVYHRITLVSKSSKERITLDTSLYFENVNGKKVELDSIVIAEVKQVQKNPSHFVSLLNELRIKPGSISKYCLGVALLFPNIKQNLFKSRIKFIHKISNNFHASTITAN